MKKILLWGIIVFSLCLCSIVNAAEVSKFEKLSNAARELYSWTIFNSTGEESENYLYNEGEEVNPFVVWQYMAFSNAKYFDNYVEYTTYEDPETGESYNMSGKFSVPASLFEDVLLKTFPVNEEYLNKYIRNQCQVMLANECEYTQVGEEHFYNYEVGYGFGTAVESVDLPLGYKDLGNNYYEMYSYLASYCANYPIDHQDPNAKCEDFVPSETDVYGEDYIIQVYDYKDENGNDVVENSVLKIVGYIKTKMYLDGEYVKFISINEMDKKDMINKSELVLEDTPSVEVKEEDIEVNADKGVFVNGAKISVDKITKGTVYEVVTKALKEKATNFVVYDIQAKLGDYSVQPNGKVKISIKVPSYYKGATIYYVSPDGKLEEMDTKVENGYAIAELEHFSTYVLVEKNEVKNPETSVFISVGILATIVLSICALIYIRFKKVNKYCKVEL